MINLLLATTGGAIVDLVALILTIIIVILGIKNGFLKTFLTTFGSLISFILAALLCSVVATFLEKNIGMISAISKWLSGLLSDWFGAELMDTTIEQASQGGLQSGGLSTWLITLVLNLQGSASIPTDTTLNQVLSPVLGYYISCALSFLVLYILFRIIFYIVSDLTKALHKIKLVGFIDRLLGAILGFIQTVLLIDIIIIVLNAIPFPFMSVVTQAISEAVYTSFINKINVIGLIFDLITKNGVIDFVKTLF